MRIIKFNEFTKNKWMAEVDTVETRILKYFKSIKV
jgi:hypothetical protein